MVEQPVYVIAVLLAVLAVLFSFARTHLGKRIFGVVPLLVFAYFLPTVLSNTGVIPLESPAYEFVKDWLLPAALVLLTMSVDVLAIARLGRPAVVLFLTATAGIVIGGPLAYLCLGWLLPVELADQAWKGLAALSGSWIGGTANMVAIGESVGVNSSTLAMIVVVDVAVASIWMAMLLYFAGREERMDTAIGADRGALDAVRAKAVRYAAEVARPTNLADMLAIVALGVGTTALAFEAAQHLPAIGDIVRPFTWVVVIATSVGLALSFTPARRLEGSGASTMGSVFLYLLVASIGAKAELAAVVNAPGLVAVGALWMGFHALTVLMMRRWMRAPIFFAAVGSQANVGGAASAPVVAAAFHPAMAPVGVLLAVGGYVLGTYAALVCAYLLEQVALVW